MSIAAPRLFWCNTLSIRSERMNPASRRIVSPCGGSIFTTSAPFIARS